MDTVRNSLSRVFAAPGAETIDFSQLVMVEEIIVSSTVQSTIQIDFGQSGPVRGMPAGWLQNSLIVRSNSPGTRITPKMETRRMVFTITNATTIVTVFYRHVEE